VAQFIEAQEDEEQVDQIQETQEESTLETTEEPVAEVQQQEAPEEELPVKYRNKDLKEIIRMHQEAEKLIGRQAQEVGEVRKLADELIKRQLDSKKVEEPATKEDEIDYFADPDAAVNKKIESHPAIKEAKEQAKLMKQMQTINRLQQEFPDFQATINDPEFAEWVKGSNVRLRLYAQADAESDFDAAAELLNTWKYIKPKPAVKAEPSAEVKQQQKAAVKQATVDVGGASPGVSSSKVYRRADLIRLQLEDPDRYYQLQDEIMAAYAEGRVK
jgi:hypothetical protein